MSTTPQNVFDVAALGDQNLASPDGDQVRLGGLWADEPEVLLFLRHFG